MYNRLPLHVLASCCTCDDLNQLSGDDRLALEGNVSTRSYDP